MLYCSPGLLIVMIASLYRLATLCYAWRRFFVCVAQTIAIVRCKYKLSASLYHHVRSPPSLVLVVSAVVNINTAIVVSAVSHGLQEQINMEETDYYCLWSSVYHSYSLASKMTDV